MSLPAPREHVNLPRSFKNTNQPHSSIMPRKKRLWPFSTDIIIETREFGSSVLVMRKRLIGVVDETERHIASVLLTCAYCLRNSDPAYGKGNFTIPQFFITSTSTYGPQLLRLEIHIPSHYSVIVVIFLG